MGKAAIIAEAQALLALPPRQSRTDHLRRVTREDLRTGLSSAPAQVALERNRLELMEAVDIADGLSGGLNPGDRRAIWHLTLGLRPETVLEIGTHVGASTYHLACALAAQTGASKLGNLITVDIEDVNDPVEGAWRRFGLERSLRDRLLALHASDLVEFVVSDSVRYLETDLRVYDLIFLDGDHSATKVYEEVTLALQRLKPDGVILLRDYFPDVRPLCRMVWSFRGPTWPYSAS